MATADLRIRPATLADVSTIARHRRLMFRDMGVRDEATLDAMDAAFAPFLEAALKNGSYRGWLAEAGASVAAGGGVFVVEYLPAPRELQCRRAWILNVYTEPEHRGRGFARSLMNVMVSWCREQHLAFVFLHASDAGRHLYESMGFKPTNEMVLTLK